MKHRDAALGTQGAQLVLELARFVHHFVDERLDDRLAERRELAAAEAAEESLHAGKADALDLDRLLVEHGHAGIAEDRADLLRLAAFVIVVAEHADDRDRASADVLGEDLRLPRLAEIGEVAAQHQHVGVVGDFGEQLAIGRDAVLHHVEVADRRDAQLVRWLSRSPYCSSRLPTASEKPHWSTSIA